VNLLPSINLATWVPLTTAEGPGKRFALWLQGCSIRCSECCNPEMFEFAPKYELSINALLSLVLEAQAKYSIEGISCLGGEPFDQAIALALFVEAVQKKGLSVMIFSGYRLEELKESKNQAYNRILAATDILIDSPYLHDLHTNQRRWIGSTNQCVHFLSKRYNPKDPQWSEPNSIDIFFDGKEIRICGFPHPKMAKQFKAENK